MSDSPDAGDAAAVDADARAAEAVAVDADARAAVDEDAQAATHPRQSAKSLSQSEVNRYVNAETNEIS